jgi:hypothetical protein
MTPCLLVLAGLRAELVFAFPRHRGFGWHAGDARFGMPMTCLTLALEPN